MRKTSVLFFPGGARHKRRAPGPLLLCLSLPCLLLFTSALRPAAAQTPGRLVIARALRVDIGHTGIHTHANSILFDTGAHDLAAMQADPVHFPHLTLWPHSRLPTDHASLPPGLAMPDDPPLPNPYGPMDGGPSRPGWAVFPVHLPAHLAGRGGAVINAAQVQVPTRFANWVALQPAARRKAYFDPRRYWLEVRWVPPTLGTKPALPIHDGRHAWNDDH